MDTRYLEFFVQTAKSGSITGAAKRLYISQQGLSTAIARLEAELKCTLFTRTAKGIALTDEGEFLLPRAEKMLAVLEECTSRFGVDSKPQTIEVACAYGVVGEFWDRLLMGFQSQNASIELTISEYPDLLCESAVWEEKADVGLTVGPLNPDKFDRTMLFKHEVTAIAHRSHPLAGRKELTIDDFRDVPIITMNKHFRVHHNLYRRCRAAGFEPNLVAEAAEVALVHKLVQHNFGIGFTVDFISRDIPQEEVVVLDYRDPTFVWDVHAITRADKKPSEGVRKFICYLRSEYGSL
ncbi:MAG: LysR family transcriptional regulator [Planctomycetes bacterium]|nr:LysR family transcriptional regulator [Planctomycetota bacterium]